MRGRLVIIFIFLLTSFLMTACIEAAIFEGHSVKLPEQPASNASNPEKDADQIATNPQTESVHKQT